MSSGTEQTDHRTWIFYPYPKINLILAGVVLGILVYSGIFSAQKDNHPIPSFYEKATGQISPSHGLSKSFSEMARGRIKSAREYNPQGPLIFLFFLVQLFMRIAFILMLAYKLMRQRKLILLDASLSILLFLFCFRQYIGIFLGLLVQ